MRKISEMKVRSIIEAFNDASDRQCSAMITVMSSWGRNGEIKGLQEDNEKRKLEFLKLFDE